MRFSRPQNYPLHFISSALCLLALTVAARAQEANPLLLELRPLLQDAVGKRAPEAVWEVKGNELTASYKTQLYTVHSIRGSGSVEARPHQEVGPQSGGFLLRVRVFSAVPDFAAPKSSSIRQAYWRGTLVRYNLRTDDSTSLFPTPQVAPTEWASETNDRIEFSDVPLLSAPYVMLQRVDKNGLFGPSPFRKIGIWKVVPMTRYHAAVALMRSLEENPDLAGNRASRLKALQSATQKAGRNLSSEELDALDSDLRELQAEFAGEMARLAPRITTDLKVGAAPSETLLPFKPQHLVFSLSQGLTQDLLPTETLLKLVNDWVEAKNKVADDK